VTVPEHAGQPAAMYRVRRDGAAVTAEVTGAELTFQVREL
jgi:hypothetical protein